MHYIANVPHMTDSVNMTNRCHQHTCEYELYINVKRIQIINKR